MKKTIFEGMAKGKQVSFNTKEGTSTELDSISPIKIIVNGSDYEEAQNLKQEDVWGDGESRGMMVARHEETCPHFGDVLAYKSYTFVCKEEQFDEVAYWLEYVLGGGCISEAKQIEGDLGLLAIRANYMCW